MANELYLHDFFSDSPFNDELRWQGTIRVAVTFDSEKKPKLSKRIVAVSKHAIWIMSKKKCDVECKLNLLELELINQMKEGSDYLLHFKKGRLDKERFMQTRIYLVVNFDSVDCSQGLITSIRRSLRYITIGFPKDFLIINLDRSQLQQIEKVESLKRTLVACGLVGTYTAICDLRQQKPDFEFISQIETLFACDSRELDLSLWHALYGVDAAEKFLPIGLALQFNVYFETLIIKDVQFPQICKYLPPILKNNKHIKNLVVSNNGTNWTAELGGSLVLNESSQLSVLDISKNSFSDSGIAFFSRAILGFSCLTALSLSQLNLNPDGINQILESLLRNESISYSLQALNMSYNTFDEKSFNIFLQFMTEIGNKGGGLNRLALSNVKIPIGKLASAAKKLNYLLYLNLSSNKHEKSSDSELISLLKNSTHLKILSLKDCELNVEIIKKLIETYNNNQDLHDMRLNLSKNVIGERGAESLAPCFLHTKSFRVLKLSNMGLAIKGTQMIIDSLPPGIRELRLNGNLFLSNPIETGSDIPYVPELVKPFGQSLKNMLDRIQSLTLLDISGSQYNKLGSNLGFILKSFKTKNSVSFLDIRDHLCGPRVFEKLCKLLHINSTLKIIHAEGNNIGLKGYIQARNTLLRSTNLLSFSVLSPIYDPSCENSVTSVLGDIFTQNGLRSLKTAKAKVIPEVSRFNFHLTPEKLKSKHERKLSGSLSHQPRRNSRTNNTTNNNPKPKKKYTQSTDSLQQTELSNDSISRNRSKSNKILPISQPKEDISTEENSRSRTSSDGQPTRRRGSYIKKASLEGAKKLEPIIDLTPVKSITRNLSESVVITEPFASPEQSIVPNDSQSTDNSGIVSANSSSLPEPISTLEESLACPSEIPPPPSDLPPALPLSMFMPQLEPPTARTKRASNSPVRVIKAYPQYNPNGTLERLGKPLPRKQHTQSLVQVEQVEKENNKENNPKERNPSDDLEAYLQGLELQQFSTMGNRPW